MPTNKPDEVGDKTSIASKEEREKASERSTINAVVIHEAIREEGTDELKRPSRALAWSGLASGLSMGFSLISQGLIGSYLVGVVWAPLVSGFGYTIGFLIVVLGRQQLFTENTLTAIIPLLHERTLKVFLNVLRLWGVVLVANLVGAFVVAWFAGSSGVFQPQARDIFLEIGQRAISPGFTTVLFGGIFGGWLIALMVWLLPAAESARVWVIIIITYFVGLGGFSHVIAGSVETLYLVALGRITFITYLQGFLLPCLIGNIVGGVLIVAVINHGQVVAGRSRRK